MSGNIRNAWSPEDDEALKMLLENGASPYLVAARLKRTILATTTRADELGIPPSRVRARPGSNEKIPAINMAHRQIMHHLRSGEWKFAARFPVLASEYALDRMVISGWLERRGPRDKTEIRLTAAGLEALKAPVREL